MSCLYRTLRIAVLLTEGSNELLIWGSNAQEVERRTTNLFHHGIVLIKRGGTNSGIQALIIGGGIRDTDPLVS